MGVSLNGGTPKSSILIGFSIINHPVWGTPIFGNTHIHIGRFRFISFHLEFWFRGVSGSYRSSRITPVVFISGIYIMLRYPKKEITQQLQATKHPALFQSPYGFLDAILK